MTHYRQCKSLLRTVTATAALATASIAQVPGYTITTVGNFGDVYGIAIDAAGNLYVCCGSVQKVSTSGTTSVVAGGGQCNGGLVGDGGPATAACLSAEGATVDAAGNLYIADTGNNRIRKVSTNGTITTIAGPGQIGILGDGGPATSASLDDTIIRQIGPTSREGINADS